MRSLRLAVIFAVMDQMCQLGSVLISSQTLSRTEIALKMGASLLGIAVIYFVWGFFIDLATQSSPEQTDRQEIDQSN